MLTLMVGDIHGDWGSLNVLINKKSPDFIIQLGDFGWWPHFHNKKGLLGKNKKFNQFGIKNKNTKIYWIPGNHENHSDLDCLTDYTPIEIQNGITYCPFGTVIELEGRKILCCGGAESIDKHLRTEGIDWWKNEIISQEDLDNLPDTDIDMIISHTAPRSFLKKAGWFNEKFIDPSTFALDLILNRYKPKYWFSGHFHEYKKETIDYCEWTSLSMPNTGDKWWKEL